MAISTRLRPMFAKTVIVRRQLCTFSLQGMRSRQRRLPAGKHELGGGRASGHL